MQKNKSYLAVSIVVAAVLISASFFWNNNQQAKNSIVIRDIPGNHTVVSQDNDTVTSSDTKDKEDSQSGKTVPFYVWLPAVTGALTLVFGVYKYANGSNE